MKTTRIISALLAALMMLSVCVIGTSAESKLPFTDTPEGEWYYDAVKYVYDNGLMNGTGDGTKFSPMMNLTRGMVVTVLYRNDGSPDTTQANPFSDVDDDRYYAAAATWAFEAGVVTGTGEDMWGDPLFSPERNITRQELATMFARYASYKHVDTAENTADIASFPDSGKVADWATDSFNWSAGTGIITGKQNGSEATLSPEDLATRAEFAIMIQRYNEKDDAREFTYNLAYEAPVWGQPAESQYSPIDDADIYVAVDGNDKNDGSKEAPLATFEAARDKVREIKKTKTKGEIVVAFMAGEYGVLDNLRFTEQDSGTADVPVKYCAYGDGDVIFCNGVRLTENDFEPISDDEKSMFPEEAVSKIYKADLNKIDEITSDTLLFSDTTVCFEARYPNKRNGRDYSIEGYTTTYNELESILLQGPLPSLVESFSTIEGLKVTGFLRTGWLVDTFPVKSYDPETKVLSFNFDDPKAFANGYTLDQFVLAFEGRMQDTVFFQNLPDFLDDTNEYWFDTENKILYLYDPQGNYSVSSHGTFMNIADGVDHLSFVGLEFNTTTQTAIYANGDHLTFEDCVIGNVGGTEAIYCQGVNHFTADGCELFNFVCDGIKLDSNVDQDLLEKDYNAIRNCYFHDFSLPQYWAHGILTYRCVGTVIENNVFQRGAHAAIRFDNSIDTIIQYNVFDRMMMTTADYGAVYTFREVTFRGNEIRYNLFTNIPSGIGGAQYAIYLDGSYGVAVYGNLFYNAGGHNIVFNDGRDNDVHDNISISNDYPGDFLMYNAGPYDLLRDPGKQEDVDALLSNWTRKPNKGEPGYELWYERWPVMYDYNFDKESVGDFNSFYSTINYVKRNKLIGSTDNFGEIYDLFGVKEANESISLTENRYFADPTHGDYTIVKNADDFDSKYIFDLSKVGIK